MLVEKPPDGLGNSDHFRRRRPRQQLIRHTGIAAHAAAGDHAKAGQVIADLCNEPQVGHLRQRAVRCAATEGNLILTRQIVAADQRNQILGHRVRERCDVETLVWADPCIRTRRDVPDRIPAAALAGQPDRHQPPHNRRRILDGDPVELNVLAGRHVEQAITKLRA